jgi:hypothetical protein
MPGFVRGELFSMELTDALAILLVDDAVVGDEELARAARAAVEAHAAEVAARFAPQQSRPAATMKVVT